MFCVGLAVNLCALCLLPWAWLSQLGASGQICLAKGRCYWHRVHLLGKPASGDSHRQREAHAVRATREAIDKQLVAGLRPFSIYVGPNDLTDNDVEVLSLLPCERTQVVFVEPQEGVLPNLRARASGMGLGNATVVNAAVCPNSTSRPVMYGFSQRLFEDYPAAATANLSHLTSLKSTWAAKRAKMSRDLGDFGLAHLTDEELRSYVEEKEIRCVLPSGLLEEVRARPEDVSIFIIDAEGYDYQLLQLFLAIPGFTPAYVQFEGSYMGLLLMRELADRGYDVHQVRQDFVGILAEAS
mmetsp:Transcript_12338/g.38098  ORF Transcript_12338/g.38098 Transcript_12338/m.38098 type:complete len:297 (-) Transcript_12338:74-964(-)